MSDVITRFPVVVLGIVLIVIPLIGVERPLGVADQAVGGQSYIGRTVTAVPRGDFPVYERYVAIDNVGGWPLITPLPNGNLALLIWPTPNHGQTQDAVACWLSDDQGLTWKRAGTPVPHTPPSSRFNHAAGVLPDGTYLAMVGGWNERYAPGWTMPSDPREKEAVTDHLAKTWTIPPVPAHSRDGGRTWKQLPPVKEPVQPSGWAFTPYGRILPLSDGSMGVFLYGDECSFFTSSDQGVTWRKRGQLSSGRQHTETTWIRLENGDLYCAARTFTDWRVDGFRSRDNGTTWEFEQELSFPMQHPADLTRLPDGRILLSYGVRTTNRWAIEARIAMADARNWSAPLTIVDLHGATDRPLDFNPRRDGGYPSTIVSDDGMLVTAYYSRGMPTHTRYHIGVVRWKLPTLERTKAP